MPKISVIVPVYKVEPYLSRCVDSILAQTYRDFELILVDDGSPDRCGEICEEYARRHPFIRVIHRQNGGLSAARNTGIDWTMAHSDSDYLAFIDSDDWVAPSYLEVLYRAVNETGCAISICGLQKTAGEALSPADGTEAVVMAAQDYYCSTSVHDGITAVAWNKLYRKDLFAKIRYPQGKLHEDEFTTYRLIFSVETVAVVEARLYAYFQNDAGIMRSAWSERRMDSLEAEEQQMAFARERKLEQLEKKAVEQYVFDLARQIPQADRAHRSQLRKKLRQGLAMARTLKIFHWDISWVYALAYPCKIFWALRSRWKSLTR